MPRTSNPDLLLLDTHVWLWLVAGSADLTTEARLTIDEAAAAGTLRIAAISLWEIALLASRGRIVLGKSQYEYSWSEKGYRMAIWPSRPRRDFVADSSPGTAGGRRSPRLLRRSAPRNDNLCWRHCERSEAIWLQIIVQITPFRIEPVD